MRLRDIRTLVFLTVLAGVACSRNPRTPGPPAPPVLSASRLAEARTLFYNYETALRAGQRDRLASFYSPSGAIIVINGRRRFQTPAQLDSTYRHGWQPPVFFAFDSLSYDALDGGDILVTGRFRWVAAQRPDTLRVVYLAVLQPTSAGPRIRVEHETVVPR